MSAVSKSPAGEQGNRESRVLGTASHNSSITNNQSTAVTPENIPGELKEYPHFVVWRSVPNRDSGKMDKVPFNPRTGSHASSTDPDTWGTFEEALATLNKPHAGWAGIGFVFSPEDPFTGIDFDGVDDAAEWVERFDSYAEYSPSNAPDRAHVIIRGALPAGSRNKHNGYEAYSHGRFFTLTGNQVDGTPNAVNGRQKVLQQFVEDVFPAAQPRNTAPAGSSHLEDDQLIDAIRSSKQGAKFDRLMSGDTTSYASHSDADGSLTMLLAFWTNRDPVQMDRIFRRSGLMRGKWDEMRGAETYGERTIRTAIDKTTETYETGNLAPARESSTRIESLGAETIDEACEDRCRALEAQVMQLRSEVTRLREVEKRYTWQWKVIENPELSATNKIVALATMNEIESAPKHQRDDDGRVAVWRAGIARRAGVNEDTVSRAHKKVLAPAGFFELDVETVKVERPDPRTGEIREMPTQQWYIRATDEPIQLLDRIAAFTKAPDAPKHGGVREIHCDEHPNAPVDVLTVTQHSCSKCQKPLHTDRKRSRYIPIETDAAGNVDYLIEDETPAETLSPQVAAIEGTTPSTVDSPYTPQVAAIEDAEDPWQQDAGIGDIPQQRRRARYEGEVWGPHLAAYGGGDDD